MRIVALPDTAATCCTAMLQARGITMKSSSISLLYVPGAGGRTEAVPDEEKAARGHLINLIDSPGHVDFCSEARARAQIVSDTCPAPPLTVPPVWLWEHI